MKVPTKTLETACPVCESERTHPFFQLEKMPAQDGVVYASEKAALNAPLGDINLAACSRCGFVGNLTHNSNLIKFTEYTYSKYHSQKYRSHVEKTVRILTDKYSIKSKNVVDVGCGEGYFLNELCKAGDNYGIGIDPSLPKTEKFPIIHPRLKLIKTYYSDEHAKYASDLICCRHVIDELPSPKEITQLMARNLGEAEDGLIYIEVPNALHTFSKKLIWNIGYAKRSWFTPTSLEALLEICGLQILLTKTLFGDEYLGVVARRSYARGSLSTDIQESMPSFLRILDEFSEHLNREIIRWNKKIENLRLNGEQMVIWGAGMRGINFLHLFGDKKIFPKIVDISVDRQGSYLPGSGYFVNAPEDLQSFKPSRILITNSNYKEEIVNHIKDLSLTSKIEYL
ncbi:methyltransferase domain-containing protein [Halieaceae bacterium IMCC14734]|uniref:Methyltransferase domain-containing protein n=1 Tax=Candidatus Litorirhabdus singularis TaxID=2518993 RepID=A0ABT3TF60_9GAMM|nr:class I SAM-dependent methyltransferase [Candidatus Litorirhabdus singularis]MCX2980951.1 methyltransferase domain-containing protein [Candidatus Litorirhabdus singularis]